jgi:excisionase family DNA binding protein
MDYIDLNKKPYLTTKEAAQLLNLSRETVTRLINEGSISAVLAGNKYVISRESLDAYVHGGK